MTRKRSGVADATRRMIDAAGEAGESRPERQERPHDDAEGQDRPAGGVREGKTAGGLVRVSAYVSGDHAEELARLANVDGLSMSALVKTAVRRYLEDRRTGRA